jgi:hypothetical protein
MATSFSGGRSRSTRREPTTMGKQLVSFITCGCESSAPFLYLQSQARTHVVLVIGLYELLGKSNYLTHWATRAPCHLTLLYSYTSGNKYLPTLPCWNENKQTHNIEHLDKIVISTLSSLYLRLKCSFRYKYCYSDSRNLLAVMKAGGLAL